jgi:hypothetical protein
VTINRLLKYAVAVAGTTGLVKWPALAMRKRRLKAFLGSGRKTLSVLHGTQMLMKRLVAKGDMNVALACGNQRQLLWFMKQRLGDYDTIESSAEIDANFVDELRKNFVGGAQKRS